MTDATALTYARHGDPDVLELGGRSVPEPGPGQVLLDVHAAGLNPYDAKVRSGRFSDEEPDGPQPVGAEVAGVVRAVGPGADVAVGDRVLGMTAGRTSGVATAALAGPVARMPDGMPFEEGAAWPVAGETAIRCLRALDVVRGETLLVHGGAGSVGRFAIQLARRVGAHVIATAAEGDLEELRALGADAVAYGDGWDDRVRVLLAGRAPHHGGHPAGEAVARPDVDAVLDAAGAGVLAASVDLAGGPGRVITIAGGDAQDAGVRFTGGASAEDKAAAIAALPGLYADGVRVPVAATFPLERAADAYRALDAREPRGKLVVTTGASPGPRS